MAGFLLRRGILYLENRPLFKVCSMCSEAVMAVERENESTIPTLSDKFCTTKNPPVNIHLPPLLPSGRDHLEGFNIELVDPDLWQVSFGLAHAWRGMNGLPETSGSAEEKVGGIADCSPVVEECPDFDEIEDLRLYKKLFYKLDRDSKEFEEYNFNFHRKKGSKMSQEKTKQVALKKDSKKMERPNLKPLSGGTNLVKQKRNAAHQVESSPTGRSRIGSETPLVSKKVRTPTYNQVTDPYHLPFCLDIYISKGSVRACIVHRVTSKVVAVAHSISKDMKFDLASRKDSTACAAVGGVLAQRAIADDIHNVVYTPRKGEKIEGKLQIVLQSIIDHGIDVKVKLKQKRALKVW